MSIQPQPQCGGDDAENHRHRRDNQHPRIDAARRDRNGNPGQPQDVADHQSPDAGDPDRSQKLIMWPTRPWKHSCSASDIVGWVWTFRASSLAVRSHFCARVNSGSSSETSCPMRCPPISSPYLPSAISLTKPLGSPTPWALALAVNGNLATFTS